MDQTNELIQHELSQIMARELELPAGALITISKVRVSKDLNYATVYITISPAEEVGRVYGILRDNLGILGAALGETIQMRRTPKLSFRMDRQAEKVMEIEKLLDEVKESQEQS